MVRVVPVLHSLNCLCGGHLSYARLGPIVRITPDELHVNDPDLIDIVYPSGGKTVYKDAYYTRLFG